MLTSDRIGITLIGQQYETITAGRIDILAQDKDENHVVVELKRDRASDVALGQILRYLGCVRLYLSDTDYVRGFVIGREIDKHMEYAMLAHDVLSDFCGLLEYDKLGIQLKINRSPNDCSAWVEDIGVALD